MKKKRVFILIVLYALFALLRPLHLHAKTLEEIKDQMQFLSDRDMILSKNIANADTPNYRPKDLSRDRSDIQSFMLDTTNPMHISYETGREYDLQDGEVMELKYNGNAVNLEYEMMQKNENAIRMQEAANLYNKARSLMKIAINGSSR